MLEVFLSPWGIGSIIVAILLFGLYYFKCAKKILDINKQIDNVISADDVVAALQESESLKQLWKVFEKSLTKTNDATYSTIDSAEFFSTQNLTNGMNMTFWQSYDGIFTGLGILGTFAGLTLGLSGIDMSSGDIETLKSGIANLLSGVETAFVTSLIGISCALIYSGFHHWLIKSFQENVKSLNEKLDEIFPRRSAEDWLSKNFSEAQIHTTNLQTVDTDINNQTTLLQNIGTDISNQTTTLQNIGEQIAEAIFDGFDARIENAVDKLCDKLEERLIPQTDKICEAIDKLDGNLINVSGKIDSSADKICVAIDKLDENLIKVSGKIDSSAGKICTAIDKLGKGAAEGLNNTITEIAGAQMDRFSAALDKFSNSIDEKLKTAGEISQIMNEQLLDTLKKLNDSLNQHAETSAKERDDASKQFLETLNDLISALNKIKTQNEDTAKNHATEITTLLKAFREIIDEHNKTIQKTLAQIQQQLSVTEKFLRQVNTAGTTLEQAAEPVRQSSAQLKSHLTETNSAAEKLRNEIATQMSNLSNVNQTTRQNISDLTERLSTFVNNFNGIADELENSTKTINDSLSNYNDKINDGLKNNLTKFDNSMKQAFSYLNELVEELSGVIEDSKQIRRR